MCMCMINNENILQNVQQYIEETVRRIIKEESLEDYYNRKAQEIWNSEAFKKSQRAHMYEPDENYIKNRSKNMAKKLKTDNGDEMPEAEWRSLHTTSEHLEK